MKRLKKNYYLLPEAAECSNYRVDDFLSLAEERHIKLWALAHSWHIAWSDEAGSKETIKPPLAHFYSGYLSLSWRDIRALRVNKHISPTIVYVEKDGQEFIGNIDTTFHFVTRDAQQKYIVKIDNLFISYEDILRIDNKEFGDRETREDLTSSGDIGGETNTELKSTDARIDGRSARVPFTQARNQIWQQACDLLKKKNPSMSINSIAEHISREKRISDGKKARTIRRIIRFPKKLANN